MHVLTPGMTAMRIGDYELERSLAATTAGIRDYEATHVVLPRRAHLRIAEPAAAKQLLDEACVLETLRHPGVPRIFECGLDGDRPWSAHELVDGPTLANSIACPPQEALALLRDVAEILHHAHVRGIVHGRLTPAAIVRQGSGVYVTGWSAGTACDAPADVAALAAVVAAVTGPPVPPGLAQLLARMTTDDVFARPTAAEVRAQALRLLEDEGVVEEVEIELVEDLALAGGVA